MKKQRVTMADVAKLANVSKMSVSRVLRDMPGVAEETRQRIIEAVGELGYFQQQYPNSFYTHTRLIALIIPNYPTLYMGEIFKGLSHAAEMLGCGLMIYTQSMFDHVSKNDNNLSPFRTGLIDGVIMVVPHDYLSIAESIDKYELPYVIIDHHSEAENEASVTATNRKGMLEATRYLLALGHRRIAFVTGRMDVACSHDRIQGFHDGLAEIGLSADPDLLLEGDFKQASGYHQTCRLMEMGNPPTAVILSNDLMAYGALEAVRTCGLQIGQDVSIVGFDDIFLSSQTYPPLTTVRQPLVKMGEVALDILIDLLQERKLLKMRQELPTELIIRESTGPVANKRYN